jgi:Holliday junction resolvase
LKEADIQRDIIAACEACGAIVLRMNAGKGRVNQRLLPAGTPDLYVIGKYHSVWIEVKTTDGKLRPAQVEMIQTLRDRGHAVVIARGVDEIPLPI